jgi:hypothetical protein
MRVARGVLKKQGLVTAIFHNKGSAASAFSYLVRNGYDPSRIVVVMTQETQHQYFDGKAKVIDGSSDGRNIAEGYFVKYLNQPESTRELPSAGLVVAGPFITNPLLNNKVENARILLEATGIEPDRAIIYEPELHAGAVLFGVLPNGPTDRYTIGNSWRKSEGELILGDDEDF